VLYTLSEETPMPNPTPYEHYWLVEEIAAHLRVQEETVRRWLRGGQLHGMLLSRQTGWRIADSELRRFITERGGTLPEPEGQREAAAA